MTRRVIPLFIAILIVLVSLSFSQDRHLSLSLDQCIANALKNNLGVAVEVLNPDIASLSISRAKEFFLPALNFRYGDRRENSPAYSWFDAADRVRTLYSDYSAAIDQFIPTGGRFSINLFGYNNDTNRRFQTINPRYGSTITFDFSQPLLKNFGFKINRREIIVASNNWEISEYQLNQSLLDTIYSVEQSYWILAYSIADLEVKQQSLKLAQDLLEENKRKVEVGTMAPIEIYTAEAEVATREADILQSETMVKNSADRLKTIMNLPVAEMDDSVEVFPVDRPDFEKKDINVQEAMVTALANRPDLKAMKIDLKNQELNLSFAKNQLLPELNFQVSYWSPGVSGDRILYENDNPISGVIIGSIPGSPADALKDAFKWKYNNWFVGLTLSVPFNTIFSRAQHAQAKVNLEQALLKIKNQEQQIFLEIKTAVRNAQTNYKRVQAYRAASELARKKLEAEQEKFSVGKSTNYLILLFQRDASNARSTELRAMVDYVLSLAYLDKVLGTTFQSKNIKFSQAVVRSKPKP